MIDLMKYLTSNYNGTNIIKLIEVINNELNELNDKAIELGEQSVIDKSTWGLGKWEEELGIKHNPSFTFEERREVVKARIRGRGTTTLQMMKNTAESFSGGQVDVLEYPDEFRFIVKFIGTLGIPKNMGGFIEILEMIKPAHLIYDFEYAYRTHAMLSAYTHTELSMYTHQQLREGVI